MSIKGVGQNAKHERVDESESGGVNFKINKGLVPLEYDHTIYSTYIPLFVLKHITCLVTKITISGSSGKSLSRRNI